MGGIVETLRVSAAADVPPGDQRRLEGTLLAHAGRGECHLHLSTLRGELLAPGRFHPAPSGDEGAIWHRHTGGRAVAAGNGFLLATISLPQRSALVATERLALRPEQVINRCVRGLLAWLRGLGLDPSYPGLDWITVGGQRLAHLSFVETATGPTLFQAILGLDASLAESTLRLDRMDPDGHIPAALLMPDDCTTLRRLGGVARSGTQPAEHLGAIAAGYASTFGSGVEMTQVSEAADGASPCADDLDTGPGPAVCDDAVRIEGKLGTVSASLRVGDGRIQEVQIGGDLIARPDLPSELDAALCGERAEAEPMRARIRACLDGQDQYLLGIGPDEVDSLFTRALTHSRP